MSDSTLLEFPTLLKDAESYLEAHKPHIKNLVCFVELDGNVTFLSTSSDIALLYLIKKRIELEMSNILAERYEFVDEESSFN